MANKPKSKISDEYYSSLRKYESNNGKALVNPQSSARGDFQFLESTWNNTTKAHGLSYTLEDRLDPKKSLEVVKLFTEDNKRFLESKLGREVDEGELYLAHLLGPSGALKLINNPGAAKEEVLSEAVLNTNPQYNNLATSGDIMNWAGERMGVKPKHTSTPSLLPSSQNIMPTPPRRQSRNLGQSGGSSASLLSAQGKAQKNTGPNTVDKKTLSRVFGAKEQEEKTLNALLDPIETLNLDALNILPNQQEASTDTAYREGGSVDPTDPKKNKSNTTAKNFVRDWFRDPITLDKLTKNLNITPAEANSLVTQGLYNMSQTNYKNTSSPVAEYNKNNRDMHMGPHHNLATRVHEHTHSMGDLDKKLSKYAQDKHKAILKTGHLTGMFNEGKKKQYESINSPGELYPRLMEMRFEKQVSPGDVWTEDMLEFEDTTLNQMINNLGKEKALKLLNSIASNEQGQRQGTNNVAEHGLFLPNTTHPDGELITEFNSGGRHSENPYGGIPLSRNDKGGYNLVEEGETRAKDYIFSDTVKISQQDVEDYNLPEKYANKTIAEATRDLNRELEKSAYNKSTRASVDKYLDKLILINENNKEQPNMKKSKKNNYYNLGDKEAKGMSNGQISSIAQGAGMLTDLMPDSQAKDALSGATNLAGVGAAFGPWGAVGGAALGGLVGLLGGGGNRQRKANEDATNAVAKTYSTHYKYGGKMNGGPTYPEVEAYMRWRHAKKPITNFDAQLAAIKRKFDENPNYDINSDGNASIFSPSNDPAYTPAGNVPESLQTGELSTDFSNAPSFTNLVEMANPNSSIPADKTPKYSKELLDEMNSLRFNTNPKGVDTVRNLDYVLDNPDSGLIDANDSSVLSTMPFAPLMPGENKEDFEIFNTEDTQNFLDSFETPGPETATTKKMESSFSPESLLRYAPAIGNLVGALSNPDPEVERLDRIDQRYQPQLFDERSLLNAFEDQTQSVINAVQDNSGGSGNAARANTLMAQIQGARGLGQAFFQGQEQNRREMQTAQEFDNRNNRVNLQQSNLEKDINARNRGAAQAERAESLDALFGSLGNIGTEMQREDMLRRLTGYGSRGQNTNRTLGGFYKNYKANKKQQDELYKLLGFGD